MIASKATIAVGIAGLFPLLGTVAGSAQLLPKLSFGYQDVLDGNSISESWHVAGDSGHIPPILSDRIILTPPHPGNRRGWMWATTPNSASDWQVDFEFRASGPERGEGSLNLWYAAEGPTKLGPAGLYDAGRFNGMTLVLDQHQGLGGSLRLFVNDGTKEFSPSSGEDIDSQVVGMCKFGYRDTGFPIPITLKNAEKGLEIYVNGQHCIHAESVRMPPGLYFGLTASSGSEPDSFELVKFITFQLSPSNSAPSIPTAAGDAATDTDGHSHQAHARSGKENWEELPDAPASSYIDEEARFKDLHDRISIVSHQVHGLMSAMSTLFEATTGSIVSQGQEIQHQNTQKTDVLVRQLRDVSAEVQRIQSHLVHNLQTNNGEIKRQVGASTREQMLDLYDKVKTTTQQSQSTAVQSIQRELRAMMESMVVPLRGFWHLVYAGICQGIGLTLVIFPLIFLYLRVNRGGPRHGNYPFSLVDHRRLD